MNGKLGWKPQPTMFSGFCHNTRFFLSWNFRQGVSEFARNIRNKRLRLHVSCRVSRFVGVETPVPTYSTFRIKIKSFKPRLSDTLRLDEREVCLSIPKLPEAKLRRVMRRSLKPEEANGVRSEAGWPAGNPRKHSLRSEPKAISRQRSLNA